MESGSFDLLRSKHFIPMLEMLCNARESGSEGMMVSDFFILTSSQTTIKRCLMLMRDAGAVTCECSETGRRVPKYRITDRGTAMLEIAKQFDELVRGGTSLE